MEWNIPLTTRDGDHLQIKLEDSDRLFIVGANGTGKSALIQHFVSSNQGRPIRRIAAHRQTWLSSGTINLTPMARRQIETRASQLDARPDARWMEHGAEEKLSAVLFDLVACENARARFIAGHVDNQNTEKAAEVAATSKSPFSQLNELLALGTLTVTLENSKDEELLARHRGGAPFSIAKLSDGERNAVIIAATIITIEPGTALLIDEPERHLHRSIIEPFLSALFEHRKDCPFVVSTHEISLPGSNPDARVLMPRSCEWNGDTAKAWDVQVLEPNSPLPEELRLAILGSRRRILFVEGRSGSLDQPLYNALFPGLSVVPKGGCSGVKRAVNGLRGSLDYHHVEAFGLIDRDDRTEDDVEKLTMDGVFALDVHSAEALYYSPAALSAVAHRQAESLGTDANNLISAAKQGAIETLKQDGVSERMAARRCERHVRELMLSQIPGWESLQKDESEKFSVQVDSPYKEELERFKTLLEAGELHQLLARYPLRESGALNAIAGALQCGSRNNYEQMVLSRLQTDEGLGRSLKEQIGTLAQALEVAPNPEPAAIPV